MIGNIVKASVEIEGTKPLMWNAIGPETFQIERRERTGIAGNEPDEWKRSVLFLPDTRQLFIRGSYIFGCLREASKRKRSGRSTYQANMVACLQVVGDEILVDRYLPEEPGSDPEAETYIDSRIVINPTTKARNLRHRIMTRPGWHCTFQILWDRTLIAVPIMQSILQDAGLFVGVGNGRNIGMGRFQVQSFELVEPVPVS